MKINKEMLEVVIHSLNEIKLNINEKIKDLQNASMDSLLETSTAFAHATSLITYMNVFDENNRKMIAIGNCLGHKNITTLLKINGALESWKPSIEDLPFIEED